MSAPLVVSIPHHLGREEATRRLKAHVGSAHLARQPLILAYLVAGFFIGPFGMGWVKSQESIAVISELGLIFMLFMIGLEIDLKKMTMSTPAASIEQRRSPIARTVATSFVSRDATRALQPGIMDASWKAKPSCARRLNRQRR